ncbi:MAG TPA: murein biosynthesis integral membrane protein MurJ [Dehalococcoidia bacterium]|nr:murein biosynthesis integral membrane protein MurJ [Dehalococcoidia bacterium]
MRLATAALIIMLGNVGSRLLGIVREQVIAALFGLSGATDAFTVADRIPRAVYDLIIGSMITALVPVFSEDADEVDPEAFWRLLNTVLTLLSIVLATVVALLIVFTPQLVAVFGYPTEDAGGELAVRLTRVALPVVFFLGLGGVVTAALYGRRRFVAPALANAGYNGGIIVVALLLHERFDVLSLVLGILAGGLCQLVIQLAALGRFRLRPVIDLRHPAIVRIARLYVPVALGVGITSIGVAIDTNLARGTGEGNISAMRFATTLVQFPLGLVATALSHAILPTLSRQAAETASDEGERAFRATLGAGARLAVLAMLPAAVGLLVLRIPVIEILFQRGRFETADTERTAVAFLAYSPGLVAAALDQLLIAAFYARRDTLTPNLVAGAGVIAYLLVALPLVGRIGMPALALANSVQIASHMLILWVLLQRRAGSLPPGPLVPVVVKAVVATALMTATLLGAGSLLGGLAPEPPSLATFLRLALFFVLGVGVYGAALILLRVEEAGRAAVTVRARLGRIAGRVGGT